LFGTANVVSFFV